jgi:leucyl-tRNA synthetase
VSHDFETLKYNTAIAQMMTFVNEAMKVGKINRAEFKTLLLLLNPVSPHVTEEMWVENGYEGYLHQSSWPSYEEAKTVDAMIKMAVQINGKVRGTITIPKDADKDAAKAAAMAEDNIVAHLEGKNIVKEIFVPGRIFNIVAK